VELKKVIYTQELVIFKNQKDLKPVNHFNFVKRFDPAAPVIHGHGTLEIAQKKWKGKPSLLAAVSKARCALLN